MDGWMPVPRISTWKKTNEPVKEKKIFNIAEFIIFVEQKKNEKTINKKRLIEWLQEEEEEELQEQ